MTRTSRRFLLLGVSCTLLSLAVQARPAQANSGGQTANASISGRVVDGDTGQPVVNAHVTLRGSNRREYPAAVTAANGAFEFNGLEAGVFSLAATAADYLRGTAGALTAWDRGRPIAANAGERVSGEVVRLWRRASISGTVRDEFGEPVVQAIVQPLRLD